MPSPRCTIVGRSSSHFTRVARIFGEELGVSYQLQVVPNLGSQVATDYADNPALKVPILRAPSGTWFGTLNICRELLRQSGRDAHIVWPEDLREAVLANAQELVLHAMASEVTLIMQQLGGQAPAVGAKTRTGLVNTLEWLDAHASEALRILPTGRDLSFLEVTLFCLVDHLDFREVLETDPYPELRRFRDAFAQRHSAQRTPFCFD